MPIRALAVQLVTAPPDGTRLLQKDFAGEARILTEFVRDQIRYVGDIADVETLHDPLVVLDQGAGDCDDKAILLAALLLAIGGAGHQVRFIAAETAPGEFTHVWLQDLVYGRWLDLEPTEPIACGQHVPLDDVSGFLTQDV